MIVTVVLSILAMIVARPLGAARERAMVAAAQGQMRNTISAIEQYVVINGQLPRRLTDLESVGIGRGGSVEVCWFEYSTGAGGQEPYVLVEARHRASKSVVQTRHPVYNGRMDVIPKAEATGPCRE